MHLRRSSDAKSYRVRAVTFPGVASSLIRIMNSNFFVTGATGNVGRPLVDQLAAAGAEVRAVTRHPDTAQLSPRRRGGRLGRRRRCRGASAVFLNSRALGDELATVVDARTRGEGVTRLVALSAINADDDFSRQPSRFRGDRNKEVEQLAVDSGLEWVSLRPTVFVTNFFGMWAPQIKTATWSAGPYAAASTAPIVDRDISAVAAHALLTDELVGRKIPLTGPQALTNAELVDVIGASSVARCATRRCPPISCAQRFIGLGFPRRVRRRVHGAAGGDGVQARTGHPRGGEDPRPPSGRPSPTLWPLTANCSAISKGDKTCRNFDRPATSSR